MNDEPQAPPSPPKRRGRPRKIPSIDLTGPSAAQDADPHSTEAVTRALAATGGNRAQAAKALGIGLRTLQRRLVEINAQSGNPVVEPRTPVPPAQNAPAQVTRTNFTARQMAYIGLRAQGLPAVEAARQAGYRSTGVLDKNPAILAAIDRMRADRFERAAARATAAGIPTAATKPLAAQLIDGFESRSGPVTASGVGSSGKLDLGLQIARDLSSCTRGEIEERWSRSDRSEIEGIMDRSWADIVPPDHHPWYFLAQRCWFDNVLADPSYLYAPYHRDRLIAPIFDYIYDPDPDVSGFLFLGPRESYKTTFTHGVIVMGYVLRGLHIERVHRRVVLRHHKLELASDSLVKLKSKFMAHPWVRHVWAEACPPERAREFGTSARFTLPWVPPGLMKEPTFRAIGLSGTDTGYHQDLDMGDDLVTEDHLSKIVRDEAKIRYRAKRYQLGGEQCREINSGTPYHRQDLWSMMLNSTIDGKPVYRTVVVPAHLPDSMGGGLAMPHKLTEKFLTKRRLEELANAGNEDFYYLQYECTYRLARQQSTEEWWLRECSMRDVPDDVFPIITLDPAWKGDKTYGEGDSASMQVWGLVRRGASVLRYLIDGVHSNEMSSADGQRELFRLMHKYGVRVIAPELREGSTFKADIIRDAGSQGIPIVLIDLKTKRMQKADRIGTFLKECEAGRVFIVSSSGTAAPGGCDPFLVEQFRSQFKDWPQVDHDDALDAAAYGCDPAVMEAWTPVWGSARPNRPWERKREPMEEFRTRYTLI